MVPGEWHHVVYTWNSQSVAVYLDGVLHERTSVGYNLPSEDETILHLGSVDGKEGFDGVLDEITIVNKALSGSEVSEYYNLFKPLIPDVSYVEDCESVSIL